MKKDTIYIDVEDDITSIIEKVKAASEKIVALVPPKRAGVLQSAVNLKLLHKASTSVGRRIVLITHDKALASLAAGVQIPVAKTLQSRPELASVNDAPDTSAEDVINGEELPVGELAKTAKPAFPTSSEDEITLPDSLINEPPKVVTPVKPPKKGSKIPNFDKFRKKLFLIIGGVVLLIIFLVWATIFAPHAEVNIKAKTSSVDVVLPVALNPGAVTTPDKALIKPLVQQVKKTNSADFTATGKKDVGEKATGSITIYNCSQVDKLGDISRAVPAGSGVSSDGNTFITQSAVTVDPSGFTGNNCKYDKPSASVPVIAQNVGEQYNLKKGSIFTISAPGSGLSGTNPNAFTGGTKRQVTFVSDSDVSSAEQKINSQDQAPVRQELTAKFDPKNVIIVTESFTASPSPVNASPAVGTEASAGKVTIETTYTLFAITKKDATKTLEAFLRSKIKAEKDQKVYDTGVKKLKITKYAPVEGGGSVQFATTGYTGPKIDADKIKPGLVGKNYEEIRQQIKAVNGVEDVDTKFSPFWVSSVNDEKKIDIRFSVSQ